ncbi:MAG: thiamine pyrophosphate-dependent enzyme [Bacteroidota bacterium]
MKKLNDILLQTEPFSEVVIGNTAIVRAMMESGVRVVTSYPGSPTPEIATAIQSIPSEQRPFYFEFSVNEKVATEVAFGAAMNGHTSCVFFKSVGLNVAADSFIQLGFFDIKGGMVVVLGDDPGALSSQNEQDNRHYAHMSYIPVFEPASPAEVYQYFKVAVQYSRELQMPVIFRMTTHVCHGKEKVDFGSWENKAHDMTPRFEMGNTPLIPITTLALDMKRKALGKLNVFSEALKHSSLNQITNNNSDKGIITSGATFLSLLDVLSSCTEPPDILKLGITYPLSLDTLAEFLSTHKEVKVLEELDDILEKEIKTLCYNRNIQCKVIGKSSIEDWMGEYTPDKVYDILQRTWKDILPERVTVKPSTHISPPRPPQLCPGCGHRPVFTATRKALAKTDITVADIGCHTLGYLPPHHVGQVLLSMGHSTATASGLSLFNKDRKVVAFLGDSTFFHAGLPGIVNALFNNHNLTLVILPNGTTGMTGHQDHPGSGKNFNGETTAIPIKQLLEGMGVKNIRECGAYNQAKYTEHLKASINEDGLSVIIAEHPCMLKKTREQKRGGTYMNNKINILQENCELLLTCISSFACPSFQTENGKKIWVHEDLCIGDGSCIQTCEAKAIKLKKKNKEVE